MVKFKLVFYSTLLVAIVAALVFQSNIVDYIQPRLEVQIQEIEKAAVDALVRELKSQIEPAPQIQTPPPLRLPVSSPQPAEEKAPAQTLTVVGVVQWTNMQREQNGLPDLSPNAQLKNIASLRAQDMFGKQYFAHLSPSGSGVKDVVREIGYEYIAVGENLALGNFESDEALVQAWMDSPGHRENILSGRYTEIGIAVQQGFFEGRKTWIAVQIFGKSLSLCPGPDPDLKVSIEEAETQLQALQNQLDVLKAEIDSARPGGQHNRKIREHNKLVAQYNNLLEQTKVIIAEYNAQIAEFNECVKG